MSHGLKEAVAESIELPPGYSLTWSGQYEYMLRVKEKLSYAILLPLPLEKPSA